MRLADDATLRLSPSDLAAYLACRHVTQLEVAVQLGEIEAPQEAERRQAALIRRKGEEHEAAFLAELRAAEREIVEIGLGDDGLEAAALRTEEALRAGVEVVYQGVLASGGWRGLADFLVRIDEPSVLGAFSYEAWDTKLARHAKPNAVLQLTFYSHELERIQGLLPERMRVVLGTGATETFRPADFAAFYRRVRTRLEVAVRERHVTYPYPCDHCGVCAHVARCNALWDADDHLLRVAQIRRDQIERLHAAGIGTLTALGDTPAETPVPNMAAATFEALRSQAELQLRARRTSTHTWVLLEPRERRGLGLLPEPSPGDVFYDIEGDPFFEPGRGLEYLHGLTTAENGSPAFRAIWAHDRDQERSALEQLVDLFHERRARWPGMHVYHYASYETAALRRLAAEHGTREEELDELLRNEVFVDLYTVTRQALRISHPSYSIKKVRTFFMRTSSELDGGDDAIVLYEDWIVGGRSDQSILDAIERYNEEDCLSTLLLRDWLVERRDEAEALFGAEIPWRGPPVPVEPEEDAVADAAGRARLREELHASGDPALASMADLLDYHRREAKPVWWAFFDRCDKLPSDLVEDAEAIGCLAPDGAPPVHDARSLVHGFRYPAQQHRFDPGDTAFDPLTRRRAGAIETLDDGTGSLSLRRGPKLADVPLPEALIPGGPYDTRQQRAALSRLGRSLAAGDGRYRHLQRLLRREPPLGGARVQRGTLEEMRALVESVEDSYLFVQGPPGAGKTWTGARLITHLLGRGRRVGVASTSHKAIHTLLAEVEAAAADESVTFSGLKKATNGNDESFFHGGVIENEPEASAFPTAGHDLFAGTGWLFAREELDGALDYLFVDEAGQVSLADALALGTCARTLVLLGDPVQLAQVTQGVHPGGAGASVLAHLLGERATVAEEMGLFLERSWRMHPDVCRYVSSAFYDDRLVAAEPCTRQGTSAGTGLRWLPVEHDGNSTSSEEEAARIRSELERLLGETWTDAGGITRPIGAGDVMVVTPYNAQVELLRGRLPDGVAVGTVDKFQGQQAPVVFFSMASSSGADAPRSIDFLLSRNRLNVAISRAQCLAHLVASPRLLDVECKTIEHMRLANALCRFVELAEPR